MRNGGRITTALLLAVAFCATAHGALAETDQTGDDQDSYILAALARPAPAQPPSSQLSQDPARFLLFSTTDLWRHGGFAHGGVLWAPSGLDQEGPALKLMFGGGIYHYVSGALGNAEVRGTEFAAAILPGWRFVRNGVTVTVFLGYDFQRHSLSPDDLSAGLRGHYHGARAGFELWYQPTPATMIAADASLSSVGPSYNVRIAAGLRAFDAFYVGPEFQAFGADDNYHQLRAGLHATGLRTGEFEWSVGANCFRFVSRSAVTKRACRATVNERRKWRAARLQFVRRVATEARKHGRLRAVAILTGAGTAPRADGMD